MDRYGRGFSLVELMVAVVVAASLLAIAVPNMHGFIQRNRITSISSRITTDVAFARGHAVSTRSYVSICPRAATVEPMCATTGNYDGGWLIYTAATPNTGYDPSSINAATRLLRVAMTATLASTRSPYAGPLTYNGRGELLVPAGLPGEIMLTTCARIVADDPVGINTIRVPGSRVLLNRSGRVLVQSLPAGTACA